jgi:hypothetical protein
MVDKAKVGDSLLSTVFMFTLQHDATRNELVRLEPATARIGLTNGHYKDVNGKPAAAKTVVVGAMIELGHGAVNTVKNVSTTGGSGLYLLAIHGDIADAGVRTSTYTTAVARSLAFTLLALLRCRVDGSTVGDPSLGLLDRGSGMFMSIVA